MLHVTERSEWRGWLRKHYRTENDIWLVYSKKHTGRPRISYNDAVEEALCFGWIDSVLRTIDADRFAQRFSVRKSTSRYSQANKERLRALVRQGKVVKKVLETLPELSDDFHVPSDILEEIRTNAGAWKNGSSGFLVGGTGHERASKRPHLRTVDRWNADWGALALMVERWLVPLIPFPSYKLCASDRPGAVKGARFARRSEPLTARTDLESYEGEGKGILQPSSHLPTKNPEEPEKLQQILAGICTHPRCLHRFGAQAAG